MPPPSDLIFPARSVGGGRQARNTLTARKTAMEGSPNDYYSAVNASKRWTGLLNKRQNSSGRGQPAALDSLKEIRRPDCFPLGADLAVGYSEGSSFPEPILALWLGPSEQGACLRCALHTRRRRSARNKRIPRL
jgi:hypothetical protein